jgi:hypothetical protein
VKYKYITLPLHKYLNHVPMPEPIPFGPIPKAQVQVYPYITPMPNPQTQITKKLVFFSTIKCIT